MQPKCPYGGSRSASEEEAGRHGGREESAGAPRQGWRAPPEAGRGEGWVFPRASGGQRDFTPAMLILEFILCDWERIHFCGFKPLCLW